MSAPSKVNSDIPLIDLPRTEAAKRPSDKLTLKVHSSLEEMREALLKRESAFTSATELQKMVANSESKSQEEKK